MREGDCIICGKHFTYTKGQKKTCSPECGVILNRRKAAEYRKQTRSLKNEQAEQSKPQRRRVSNLTRASVEAKKLGISYGQYMQYIKGNFRIERSEVR